MSKRDPFESLSNHRGQTVTLVLPDGTRITATLTHLELSRNTNLVYPEDLIPPNIELPPDFIREPQWHIGPTVASITLQAHEGDQ